MSYPFWVHCNFCAALPSDAGGYYFLSCSHVLCRTCMNQTDRGTKCPSCKTQIKFIDIKKLPSKHRDNFQPQGYRSFKAHLKKVHFQSNQQRNLTKLSYEYRVKAKKATEIHGQLITQNKKREAILEKMSKQRHLMQQRLKEVYIRKQNAKIQSQRKPINSFSSGIGSFGSNTPVKVMKNPPGLAMYSTSFFSSVKTSSTSDDDFFGSSSSKRTQNQHQHQRRSSSYDTSQSTRSPFFA